MSAEYFKYKSILLPTLPYSEESLRYAEEDFPVRDDDVFNVTFPKSGTVWMNEILSLIRRNGDPTWNREVPNWDRMPWYETISGKEKSEKATPPRMFSSHLPIQHFAKSFFNTKAKIIYTCRNPKDVLVSLFYYSQFVKFMKDPGNFNDFMEDFLEGKVAFGSWFDHVKGWMEMKNKSNFLLITYEELLEDTRGTVVKICEFLGKELDDAVIDSVVENSSFEVMKGNKMCNFSITHEALMDHSKGRFLRKGVSGDWKNHFTVAQSERFDTVYKERMKGLKMRWDETN